MFRKEHRRLTQQEHELVEQLRAVAQDLHDVIDILAPGRERDAAMMRLEEAVMWAEQAILEAR